MTHDPPAAAVARDRVRSRVRGDSGSVDVSIEMLFVTAIMLTAFLFIAQVTVWWHARNILEQAAAEGARYAAAADNTCDDATTAAQATAARYGGKWVHTITVRCVDGALVSVQIDATTPAFLLPLELSVRAVAQAPKEH